MKALENQVNYKVKFSVTMAHDEVKHLISEEEELTKRDNITRAYLRYLDVKTIIDNNLNAFTAEYQSYILTKIKNLRFQ